MRILKRLGQIMVSTGISLLPYAALAQAYGQGIYGDGKYGAQTITIGPIGPIPVTGATIWGTVAAAAISMAIGLIVWARQHRRQSAQVLPK